jgi:hypothetical protein
MDIVCFYTSIFHCNLKPIMLKNITIRTRLIFVIALLGIELVAGAAIGLLSLGHANREMHATYADGMVPMGQLGQVVR